MPEQYVGISDANGDKLLVGADGSIAVTGTVTSGGGTVAANQGTAAATANAWPIKVSNGTATADLAPATPSSQGNALLVTSGILTAPVSLNALTAVGPGVVIDFGSGKSFITMAAQATVAVGAVALSVSQDNIRWFTGTPVTVAAGTVVTATQTGAWRYARVDITTAITAGTVTATLMAS